MTLNVGRLMSELERMTVTELRRKHVEVFGEETRSFHKAYLVRRITCEFRRTPRAIWSNGPVGSGRWRSRSPTTPTCGRGLPAPRGRRARRASLPKHPRRRACRFPSPATTGFRCQARYSPASTEGGRSACASYRRASITKARSTVRSRRSRRRSRGRTGTGTSSSESRRPRRRRPRNDELSTDAAARRDRHGPVRNLHP